SRRRHTRLQGDWSSDVCSSDLLNLAEITMHGNYSALTRMFRPSIHRSTAPPSFPSMPIRDWILHTLFLFIQKYLLREFTHSALRSEERRVGKECRSWWSKDY